MSKIIEKIFENKFNPFIIIIAIGFILYFQSLFFDFTYLDDNNLILEKSYFLNDFSNIFNSFNTDIFQTAKIKGGFYYRPILNISFIIDYQFSKINPFFYHLTNIIFHLISASLIYIFLQKLKYKKEISFLISLIFLTHPVLTQAVAWIPGRNDSLLLIFVLLNIITLIKFLESKKIKYFIYSIIFLILALFTKETAIFLIIPIIFYLYFIDKDINKNKLYYILTAIFINIIYLLIRSKVLNNPNENVFEIIKSIINNSPAFVQFIGKIIFPFNLSVLPIIKNTTFIYGIIAIIATIILIKYTKEKRLNYLFFGFIWFAVFLLPSFARPDSKNIADFIEHRLYLPIIGFFIIILETNLFKKINYKKKIHLIIILLILIFFSTITIIHSRNFRNKLSFWENAAKNSYDYPLARRNLGAMYYLEGNTQKAEYEFKKSLELNPQEEMAHNNLGLIYENQNLYAKAQEEYQKEIENNPYYDNVYFNLGILYYKQKKYKEAEESWIKTLEINPNKQEAIVNLFILYYEQKNLEKIKPYAIYLNKMGYKIPKEFLK